MTLQFRLNKEGTYALKIIDGTDEGEWHNIATSVTYLEWLSEGNEPLPADNPS